MAAFPRFGVEPDARSTIKGAARGLPCLVIRMELGYQIGPLPLEPIPRLFTHVLEHVVERWPGHYQAADATAVARLDDGQALCSDGAHDSSSRWKIVRQLGVRFRNLLGGPRLSFRFILPAPRSLVEWPGIWADAMVVHGGRLVDATMPSRHRMDGVASAL